MSTELIMFIKKKERRLRNKLELISRKVNSMPTYVAKGKIFWDIDSHSYNNLANEIMEICDLTDDSILS